MQTAIHSLDLTDISAGFAAPRTHVTVKGGSLAYYRFGTGPDVVAVHGWPLHAATFRRILPYLARHFTFHLFDLPGAGATRWNAPIGFESNAAALREAIASIGLTSYALLGHDSGGAMARHVAADNPHVRGLVLAGTEIPGHRSLLLRLYVLVAKVPLFARVFGAALALGPVRRSRIAFGACFEDPRYADGEFNKLFVATLRDPEVRNGQMGLARGFDFAHIDALADVNARITAPTLAIWGERDPFFPVDKARAMLAQFKGEAELVAIKGGKLFVHEDHPEEFAAHARPFLARCFANAAAQAS
jgi:pimeloyl-ACP methyl ester carboxylesterase